MSRLEAEVVMSGLVLSHFLNFFGPEWKIRSQKDFRTAVTILTFIGPANRRAAVISTKLKRANEK